jgi:hypothetical protein
MEHSQTALRAARRMRYQVMSQASEYRTMFLHEQAAATALDSDEDRETILQRLLKAQERSDMYKRLHHVFKPTHSGAISHLIVPADDDWQWPYNPKTVDEWKSEYDTKKVEDYLFERNIQHFGQSKETPWTRQPFSEIPFGGTGPIADSILAGTFHYVPTGSTGPYIALLLEQLKTKLPALPITITEEEIAKGFKVWKEITSTSPSNRRLGHYISLNKPDGRTGKDTTAKLAKHIMQVHHQ